MQVVQDSPIIQELRQEWLEQGIEKGREKGREEGERKAALKALHQTLTIRFDIAPGEFDERFESLGLKPLEQLNEVALTVQTLAKFKDALKAKNDSDSS